MLHLLAGVPKGTLYDLEFYLPFLAYRHTQCYAGTDNPKACADQYVDYFECLHHPKEVRIHALAPLTLPSPFFHLALPRESC